ncbi:MAG: hypothetical protein AAFR64_06220 [Pseudomonadota bacterium]
MKLRNYIFGSKVLLVSPLAKDEVRRRIKQGTSFGFSPFRHGVSGWVISNHVRLAWDIPMLSNGFRPVLAGGLRENRGGTVFKASYGAPFFLLIFMGFWYSFLAAFVLAATALLFQEEPRTGEDWIFVIVIPLFAMGPFAIHAISNRKANEHLEGMLDHLSEIADLRPETRKGWGV